MPSLVATLSSASERVVNRARPFLPGENDRA